MKKYLVCPGHIKSKTDGQLHYVSSKALIALYGVNPDECVIDCNLNPKKSLDLIELRPRYNGNYTLPIK